MAIYSAGRRRTILILLLTSILLITLDLRGNAVFNAARSGFSYALRPFEIAADVVTRPVERMWTGVTRVDELEEENARLRRIVDEQRSAEVAGKAALIENRRLRALLDLETLAVYDRVTGEIIGSSPSNFDQRVEINRGSLDGVRTGMPVVNEAGLVGKITFAGPETSVVMLITDPLYSVPVKIVAEVLPTTTTTPATVPSGLEVDDVTTTSSTAPPPSTSTPDTTDPDTTDPDTTDADTTDADTTDADTTDPDSTDEGDGTVGDITPTSTPTGTPTNTTTTTTTLPEPIEETRETGALNGQGAEVLPRIRFIADSPQFGRIREGDLVLTSGGSASLAPPGIPVGVVENVIQRAGTAGLELEVAPNVDLDRLSFLTIILYQPSTELG